MANLNLSQFTEKLFVSDADHTFIWDTAASISKRVSRNSWLNSGTLTSDAPVTISQTWNAGTNVMTALKVVATDTASGATSNLLELWAGSTPILRFNVAKNGTVAFRSGSVFGDIATDGAGRVLLNASTAAGARVTGDLHIGLNDVILLRDAANTLALRNGANAQTFNIYASYSDAGASYSRLALGPLDGGGKFYILATNAGTGIARGINIRAGASQDIFFGNGVTDIVKITSTGLSFVTDNAHDIGASGANRPRNVYVGNTIFAPTVKASGTGSQSSVEITGAAGIGSVYFYPNSASVTGSITNPSDGVLKIADGAGTSFNRLQFGGTADTFPAIARDGAGIKFTGAAAGSTAWIKVPPVAVSALPLAATAGAGARAFVNDASAPVFGTAVTGGGAVLVPVYSNGSAWNVG